MQAPLKLPHAATDRSTRRSTYAVEELAAVDAEDQFDGEYLDEVRQSATVLQSRHLTIALVAEQKRQFSLTQADTSAKDAKQVVGRS